MVRNDKTLPIDYDNNDGKNILNIMNKKMKNCWGLAPDADTAPRQPLKLIEEYTCLFTGT